MRAWGKGLLVVAAALLAPFFWPTTPASISPNQLACLRDGDVILFHGTGWRSRVVQWLQLTPSDYSHIGLLYRDADSVRVVHATPEPLSGGIGRVVSEDLRQVFQDPAIDGWLILRPSVLSAAEAAALKDYLNTQLGQSTKFDHAFDAEHEDALYCSELVFNAFASIGIPLLDRSQWDRANILYPIDFLGSKQLFRIMDSLD